MSNVSTVTNHFPTANEGFITTLGSTISSGAVTVPLTSVSGLTNGTIFVGIIEPKQANQQTFTGTVDTAGVQITGVKWTRGTNVDHTAGVTIVDYVSGTGQNMMTKGLLVSHDQDGTLKTGAVDVTAVVADAILTKAKLDATMNTELNTGWVSSVLPAVSSVTYNGNRSYDITFASTVASTLSSGMRLKGTKTVAGNGYMGGAFNGSSHYFVKATPTSTLASLTNNFTIEATVAPTAYQAGAIAVRADAAVNNDLAFYMNASGQLVAEVKITAGANFRTVTSYQSLPLIKKTTVAVTWQGGTAYKLYFDGIEVPSVVATGGTAPTAAGTGGDFAIGRFGSNASAYFAGYISNVAWYDAVLTAATIKEHATYKITAGATNCIGSWSLDNTAVNQQVPGTNDLTATGGVGYTAISPHGQMGDAVHTDQFAALVMSVSTTVATVQVPEGCTIPTTGGVTSVAYSVQGNPFGWVSDKGRWGVALLWRTLFTTTSNATFAAATGMSFVVPVGQWKVGYQLSLYNTSTTLVSWCMSDVSQTGLALAASDTSLESNSQSSAASTSYSDAYKTKNANHTTAATYTMYTLGATTSAGFGGNTTKNELFAEPANL